jgi:hypothetical protein
MPDDTPRSVSGELDPVCSFLLFVCSSISIVLQDSDIESHLDHADELGGGEPNKPGRKKNPKLVYFRLLVLSIIDY